MVERRDRTAAKQIQMVDKALEVIEELALAKRYTPAPETLESSSGYLTRSTKQLDDEAEVPLGAQLLDPPVLARYLPPVLARPLTVLWLRLLPGGVTCTCAWTHAGLRARARGTTRERREDRSNWGRAAGFDAKRVPVIAMVHDQKTLDSALEHWMEIRPELDWKKYVDGDYVSFISEEPLFAVTVTLGRDEWDIEHETAALLTRLMLKRAHGPLPKWIESGLTWQVETRLFQSVWHFFDRQSRFITSASHSGWEREIRSDIRRRKEGAGLFEQVVKFDPKRWSDRDAHLAWGLTGFVADELGDRLPQYLKSLSELRDTGARVEQQDGTWTYDTTFLPSSPEQFSALADLLGEDFEDRSLKAFKRGLKRSGEPR